MLLKSMFRAVALATAFSSTLSLASAGSGAVFTMTNSADGNRVLVFERKGNGQLTPSDSYPTGGFGTGGGLGNQGGLILSHDGRWMLAVNAGSSEVSLFEVAGDVLVLRDIVPSGGTMPISVTADNGLVYVLNAGVPENITGFVRTDDGRLTPLAGSTQPLSGAGVGPAQVGFNPWGNVLVVTEKGTNKVVTYTVGDDGLPSLPNAQASSGQTPFGFSFDHGGRLFVSEAFGGNPGASTLSSYSIDPANGNLTVISPSVPTLQTAACWVAIDMKKPNLNAYTTNTGSSSITGFSIAANGSLTRLDASGVTGMTGAGSRPIDMAFTRNGKFLYALSGGTNTITGFRVKNDGSLDPVETESGLPAGTNGLAAR